MPEISHKHCVFCGESSDAGSTVCFSPLNCLPQDTVGNRHHAYPTDLNGRAKLAAQKAQQADPSEIKFFGS
jgi:hypothetical protein